MIHRNPGLADVLDLFDKTAFPEKEYNGSSLDDIFHRIEMLFPECYAAREYFSWRAMPEKTAASVRATLKGALNAVFPEDMLLCHRNILLRAEVPGSFPNAPGAAHRF